MQRRRHPEVGRLSFFSTSHGLLTGADDFQAALNLILQYVEQS